MNLRRTLLAGALCSALALGTAWAQVQLGYKNLLGTEVMEASTGGPGGQSFYLNISQIRNTTGYLLTTLATGSLTATTNSNRYIFTAALSGGITLNTPPTAALAPFDGEMIEVVNGTGSNFTQTITLTASAGQTVNSGAVATLSAGTSAEWQFAASTNTWYRLR